ncbi:hypothetical protein HZS_5306, partial [Henneguya salminicola]
MPWSNYVAFINIKIIFECLNYNLRYIDENIRISFSTAACGKKNCENLFIFKKSAEMSNLSNPYMDLFLSVLNIRDGQQITLLESIDQKLQHDPKFDNALKEYVPSFLINILESIRGNRYSNLEDLSQDIFHAVKEYDDLEQTNPFLKTSAIVKRSLNAKIENIRAGKMLTTTKRTHRNSSYNEERVTSPDVTLLNKSNEINKKPSEIPISILKIFYRLPSRRKYTKYYDSVKNPISFYQIRSKIHRKIYTDKEQLISDTLLLFYNALAYYPKDCTIYTISEKFIQFLEGMKKMQLTTKFLKSAIQTTVSIPHPKQELNNSTKDIRMVKKEINVTRVFKKLVRLKVFSFIHSQDPLDYHLISKEFMSIPCKEECPNYYKIIPEPIDLTTIGNNITQLKYKTINVFIQDIALLIANARFFNNALSQIYQDTIKIEEFISDQFGLRIKEIIKAKLKNNKTIIPVGSSLYLINKLISHTLRASDNTNNKLIKVAGAQKAIRKIENNILTYHSVDEVYYAIISILQTNTQDFRQNKKLYRSNLLLLSSVNESYKLLCSNPKLNFIITPNQIITSIFENLNSIKDEFDVHCIDCLSHVNFSFELSLNGNVYTRSLNLYSIKTAIKQNLYTRVECFTHDFLSLCKVARNNFTKLSEPYLHSYKLYQEFMKLRYKYIQKESYTCQFTHDWSLDFELGNSHNNSCLKNENKLSVYNGFALKPITNSDMDASVNETGEKSNFASATDGLGDIVQIVKENRFLRKGDFLKIKDSNNHLIYQIIEFIKQDPIKYSYSLSCKEYVPIDEMDIFSTTLCYMKEIVQTDTIIPISLEQIDCVVCVLTESQYIKLRPTQYTEENVYVCCKKISENILETIEVLSKNINTFPDEIIFFDAPLPKFVKYFGEALKREIAKLSRDKTKIENTSDNAYPNYSSTPKKMRCFWEDCNFFTSNFKLLFEHFYVCHGKKVMQGLNMDYLYLEIDPRLFLCKWRGCIMGESAYLHFPSYSRLEHHVRDIHCKENISNTTADFNKRPGMQRDLANNNEIQKPINSSGISLRDSSIINFKNRLLNEKENIIKHQKQEINLLHAKNRFSYLNPSLQNIHYNRAQFVSQQFRGIPQSPFIPVPHTRLFSPHSVQFELLTFVVASTSERHPKRPFELDIT